MSTHVGSMKEKIVPHFDRQLRVFGNGRMAQILWCAMTFGEASKERNQHRPATKEKNGVPIKSNSILLGLASLSKNLAGLASLNRIWRIS